MRVFTEQLEALQRLRGKSGRQKVTVEHVHVHEGGQAIVGPVNARRVTRERVGVMAKTKETPEEVKYGSKIRQP